MAGALTRCSRIARASSGTSSSASDACPSSCSTSETLAPRGEQLAGAAVAAVRGQHRGDEVSGSRQAGEGVVARIELLGERVALPVDAACRSTCGVRAALQRQAGGERGGVLGAAGQLHADDVVGPLAGVAGGAKGARQPGGQDLVLGGHHEPGLSAAGLDRVRRPAEQRE